MEAVQTPSIGALTGTWAGGASQHVEGERGTPSRAYTRVWNNKTRRY